MHMYVYMYVHMYVTRDVFMFSVTSRNTHARKARQKQLNTAQCCLKQHKETIAVQCVLKQSSINIQVFGRPRCESRQLSREILPEIGVQYYVMNRSLCSSY